MHEDNRSTFLHHVTGNLENVEENLRKRSSENCEFHKIVYVLLENIIFDNYHSEQSSRNTRFSLNKTKLFRAKRKIKRVSLKWKIPRVCENVVVRSTKAIKVVQFYETG